MAIRPIPGGNGDKYVPYDKRSGDTSIVFFTRDLSEEGMIKIYEKVSSVLEGKIAIKLHTGEAEGPNIIPRPWVRNLIEKKLPDANIVETNTYYEGSRYTTEQHRQILKINGWDFCPVDITDENGVATLPIKGGKWFKEMHVGENLLNYESLLVLTHFKGHTMGGFGGSNKNIGIGCADGRIGKALIERVETRHGLRQLSYMKELGMGNDLYTLIDIDNGDKEITATEAVKDVEPIWKPDKYNVFWGRNKH